MDKIKSEVIRKIDDPGKKQTVWLIIVVFILAGLVVAGFIYRDQLNLLLGKTSALKELDEQWNEYVNYKLGFSIQIPKKWDAFFPGACKHNEYGRYIGRGPVPVKIFEEGNRVYLTNEFYYQASQENEEDCEKIWTSVPLIKQDTRIDVRYLEITIRELEDASDAQLQKIINEEYSERKIDCELESLEKTETEQAGVYDIDFYQGWGCANYSVFDKVRYYSQEKKLIFLGFHKSVCAFFFGEGDSSQTCLDDKIVNSFKLNH